MNTLVYAENDVPAVAQTVLSYLSERSDVSTATVLALSGNLGAGKTTLVQQLAKAMGVIETVTSPTFVVMKRYQTTHPIFLELVHIDAYRIEEVEEMKTLGFLEWLKNPQTLICIEWPEKIASLIPLTAVTATLTVVDEQTRKITYG